MNYEYRKAAFLSDMLKRATQLCAAIVTLLWLVLIQNLSVTNWTFMHF